MTKNILLVGVGGQGTILVSKLLTAGLMSVGYDVKMSEVHGMAQRGGSVSTQVRYGDKVYSPIIGHGGADVLVAFEKMEAVRWSDFLSKDATAIINDYEIPSLPVATGVVKYPEDCLSAMSNSFKTIIIDAEGIALSLGNVRCMNVVLLGSLVKAFGMEDIAWAEILRKNLPEKVLEMNLKAFEAGKAI